MNLIKNLKYTKVKHVTQRDFYNCGLFVGFFCEALLTNKDLDGNISIADYRTVIRNTLIEFIPDMKNACYHCEYGATDAAFELLNCKRKICSNCATTIYEDNGPHA